MTRDDDTTYRVQQDNDYLWTVTTYPPMERGPLVHIRVRFELLPEWIQEGVRLLGIAGGNTAIESVRAKRVGQTYWFVDVDLNGLMLLNMYPWDHGWSDPRGSLGEVIT